MQLIITTSLSANQIQQIDVLWNQEYPKNLINRFAILLTDASNYRHFIIENDATKLWLGPSCLTKKTKRDFPLLSLRQAKERDLGDN
jgi:hypothetical protein